MASYTPERLDVDEDYFQNGNPFVGVVVGLVLVSPFWVGIGFLVAWLT